MHDKRNRWRRLRTSLAVTAVMVATVSAGCGNDPFQVEEPTTTAVGALDDAIATLDANSALWRTALQDAQEKLSGDAASLVREELTNLTNRAIAASGQEVRCNVDFIGARVRQGLIRLRERILGRAPPEFQPAFCQVIPDRVDLNLPPERRNSLVVAGYDFDTSPRVQLFHETADGLVDVSDRLDFTTPYTMTVNLAADGGVPLTPRSRRLVFRWNGQDIGSVGVLAPEQPKCAPKQEVLALPRTFSYHPPWTGQGDKEVFGKVDLWARATLLVEQRRVLLKVEMTAEQYDDDHSRAAGETTVTFFDAVPPGYEIDHVKLNSLSAEGRYRDHTWEAESTGGDGFVSRWTWYGDTWKEDLGDPQGYSGVDVHTAPVTVVLRAAPDCVP